MHVFLPLWLVPLTLTVLDWAGALLAWPAFIWLFMVGA